MKGAPWFKFHVADFLGGTAEMTTAETGAYIRLLCHQWNAGSIPDDLERLSVMAGGPVSALVKSKFDAGTDGRLRNVRLESHREEAGARSQMAVIKAAKSWKSRKHATADATADAVAGAGAMPGHKPQHKPQQMPGHMQSIESRVKRVEEENREENKYDLPRNNTATFAPSITKPTKATADASPIVLTFACNGPKTEWHLHQSQVDKWAEVYPGVEIMAEMRKAQAWEDANPTNRKTYTGRSRFLNKWLNKAQNDSRRPVKPLSAQLTAKAPTVWSLTEQVKQLVLERDGMHTHAMQTENGRHVYPAKLAKFKELCDKIAALRKQIGAVEQ